MLGSVCDAGHESGMETGNHWIWVGNLEREKEIGTSESSPTSSPCRHKEK